jgi:hypothetical protein
MSFVPMQTEQVKFCKVLWNEIISSGSFTRIGRQNWLEVKIFYLRGDKHLHTHTHTQVGNAVATSQKLW